MLLFLYINLFFERAYAKIHAYILRRWSLLNRYILKEIFFTQISTLLFLYFVLLINNFLVMAETLLSLNVGVLQIIGLIVSLTPSTLVWALPFSGLIGSLLAIGRMASDNELLAASFLGSTYAEFLKPFIAYGIILMLSSFFMINIIAPQADKLFQNIMKNIAETTPNILIESNSSQKIGDTVVMTGPIKSGNIEGVTIVDYDSFGYKRVIHARSARIQSNNKDKGAGRSFMLEDVQGMSASKDTRILNYQLIYAASAQYGVNITPDELHKMTTATGKTIKSTLENLQKSKDALLANRTIRMEQAMNWLGNLSDNYLYSIINGGQRSQIDAFYMRYQNSLPSKKPDIRYRTSFVDFYQQISLPIACFIFVFLAFSLSITSRKTQQTTMLGVGVLFSMVYWFSLYMTIHLVIIGQFGLWIVAAGDMAFLLIALILYLKIKK
ncbi:MAG: LptF/LptG family permease [Spirochaetia bacterium]